MKRSLVGFLIIAVIVADLALLVAVFKRAKVEPKPCTEATSEELDAAWRAGNEWGFAAGYQACKAGEHAP